MRNKRTVIIVSVLIVLMLVIFGVLFLRSRNNNSNKVDPNFNANNFSQEPELGGPKEVVLNNTTKLAQILLAEQFEAVKTQITTYAQGLSPNIKTAEIVGQPVLNGDGSIDLTVRTTTPVRQFPVHIDRSVFNQIVFSIPGTNYSQTIQVYGSTNNSSED